MNLLKEVWEIDLVWEVWEVDLVLKVWEVNIVCVNGAYTITVGNFDNIFYYIFITFLSNLPCTDSMDDLVSYHTIPNIK